MYMENVEKLESICQQILKLDLKMRSARFINARGHLAAGGMKDGLLSLEAKKQDEMMFMELALRVRMRHEFDIEFGIVHFSLSYRDKVIVMSFPLSNDDVLLVSCEKDTEFGDIPFKVLAIIECIKKTPLKTF
jgi:hypothetical protein